MRFDAGMEVAGHDACFEQFATLHQLGQPVGEYRPDETLFRTEVVDDSGVVRGAGLGGDLAQRDAGEAMLGEQPLSGQEQLERGGRDRGALCRGAHRSSSSAMRAWR